MRSPHTLPLAPFAAACVAAVFLIAGASLIWSQTATVTAQVEITDSAAKQASTARGAADASGVAVWLVPGKPKAPSAMKLTSSGKACTRRPKKLTMQSSTAWDGSQNSVALPALE